MYQKIIIIGNLSRDPELRYTATGQAVTNFNVATNEVWFDDAGKKHEKTIWWRVATFGKQAENCNSFLQKGRSVLIEGRMKADPDTGGPRIWTSPEGSVRASFELTAMNVRFISKKGDSGGEANGDRVTDNSETTEEVPRTVIIQT